MIRRTAAARRLWTGSAILGRRVGRRLAAWVAAGRRADLSGWRTALGPLARGALLLAAGYATLRIVRAVPGILWVLTPAWLIAAYRAGKPTAPAAAAAPVEEAPDPPARDPAGPATDIPLATPEGRRLAFLTWLEKTTRGTSGIHLHQMHRALTEAAPGEGIPRTQLRPLLQHYGIPVQRTLRVGTVAGRSGVARTAIEQAFCNAAKTTPPEAESNRVEPVVHSA